MLDDDEMKQMNDSSLSRIDELNQLEKGSDKVCKPGHHHICINEYGEYQCIECYSLFSPVALRKQLAINAFWPKYPEGRFQHLKKMRTLVIKGIADTKDRIIISGYRYVDGRGYIPVDRIFYDPD